MAVEKKCAICGKIFTARNRSFKVCSPECRVVWHREAIRAFRERRSKVQTYNPGVSQLDIDAKNAKTYGLSYGYYMALKKRRGDAKLSLCMKD